MDGRRRWLGGALVVAAVLAGCGDAASGPTRRTPPGTDVGTVAAPVTTAAAPSGGDATPPAASTTPAPATAAPAPAQPDVVDCARAPLTLSVPATRRVVSTEAEAGPLAEVALDVTVTNTGSTACTTVGRATVILRGDACRTVGSPCDPSVDVPERPIADDAVPAPVEVPPGGVTTFSLVWSGGLLCGEAPTAMDVTLPGRSMAVRLATPDLCATGDDGSPLRVTPLGTTEQWQPGTGS